MKTYQPGELYNKMKKKMESKRHERKETKAHERGESKAVEAKENKMKKGMKKKNWIAGAIKKPGALHKALGVKQGKKIPAKTLAKAAKKGGKMAKRVALAKTLKSFHKGKK